MRVYYGYDGETKAVIAVGGAIIETKKRTPKSFKCEGYVDHLFD